MKNNIFKIVFVICFLTGLSFLSKAQITSGNGNSAGSSETENKGQMTGGIVGSVNTFTGKYQSSYTLGTVNSPIGLSFTLTMSNQSTFDGGDNTPFISGIPYGEGWNLNIPTINVKLMSRSLYSPDNWESYSTNTTTTPNPNIDLTPSTIPSDPCWDGVPVDGKLFYFAPELNIPGVASGRLILKNLDDTKNRGDLKGGTYVLHNFETYIEAIFNGETWTVILPDGTSYFFGETKFNVVNPSNQRFHPNDNASAIESMTPAPVPTQWMVSSIYNSSKNINYQILFKYKKLGKFNFHKETVNYNDDNWYDNSFLDLPQEIFLEEVSSVYNDLSLVQDVSIILDRLKLEYGEDISLIRPGMHYSTMASAENYDELYAGKTVYFKGATGQESITPWTDWKTYSHVKALPANFLYDIGSSDNPYIDDGRDYYRKLLNPNSTPFFNHHFLESPKEVCSFENGGATVTPPGDLYNISCEIGVSSSLPNYCNFDINLVTGEGIEPSCSTGYESYSEDSYLTARYNTVFTTFGNINKWNVAREDLSNRLVVKTSNYFYLPNLPESFRGFFIQVGPANSDNDFSLDRTTVGQLYGSNANGSRMEFYESYYNKNINVNNLNQFWRNRPYGKLQSNFGIGYPWYEKMKVYNSLRDYQSTSHASSSDPFFRIFDNNWWDQNSTTPNDNNPTLSDGFYLKNVTVKRVSKKPYVLKSVKHEILQESTTTLGKTDYLVTINTLNFVYDVKTLDVYENVIYSDPGNASRNKIAERYVIVLSRIKNVNSSNQDEVPVVSFGYKKVQLCNTANVSSELFQFQPNKWVFRNNTDGYVINKIVDVKGKVTEIFYKEFYSDIVSIDVGYNKYRYTPDLRTNFGGTITPVKQLGFSFAKQFNILVDYVKTSSHDSKYVKSIYSFSNIAYKSSPKIPDYNNSLNSLGDFGLYKGTVISWILPEYGFKNATVTTQYIDIVNVGNVFSDKIEYIHADDEHLFGKLLKTKTFDLSGASPSQIAESEYTYTYEKVFVSGYNAGINYLTEAPATCEKLTTAIMLNKYRAQFFDYFNFIGETAKNSLDANKYPNSHNGYSAKYSDLYVLSPLGKTYRKVKALEENSSIDDLYPGYRDAYFVKLSKEEHKTFDLIASETFTKTREYEYFDANHEGKSTSKGYDYILRTQLTTPQQYHQLKFEPSWQLYAVTDYSTNTPGISNRIEYFYYYDLINKYGAFETSPNFLNEYPMSGPSSVHKYSFDAHTRGANNFTENGLEAMGYSHYHKNRTVLMETRQINKRTGENDHIQSKYYLYKVLPKFDPTSEVIDPTTGQPFDEPEYDLTTKFANIEFKPDIPVLTVPPPGSGTQLPEGPTYTVVGTNGGVLSKGGIRTDPTNPNFDPTLVGRCLTYTFLNPNDHTGTILHEFLAQRVNEDNYGGNIYEYLLTVPINETVNTLIPGYNDSDVRHKIVASYLINSLVALHYEFYEIDSSYTLPLILPSQTDSSIRALILYDKRYIGDSTYPNDWLNPFYVFTDSGHYEYKLPSVNDPRKDYSTDFLRLDKEIVQVDYVVKNSFTNKFSNYSSSLPPILNFEFKPGTLTSQDNHFVPIFPYDTMMIVQALKYNQFGKIAENYNQNYSIEKSTLFPQKISRTEYINNTTGQHIKYEYAFEVSNIGLSKEISIADGTTNELTTSYEYYNNNLVKKTTSPNGEITEYEYDVYFRPTKKKFNGYTLSAYSYSSWHTENIYNTGSSKGNSVNDNFAIKNSFNFVDVETYIEGTSKYTVSRNYFEADGRPNQSAAKTYNNGFSNYTLHSGKSEYDLRGLAVKNYKPYKVNTSGRDVSFYNFNTASQLHSSFKYEQNLNARLQEAADFGMSIGGLHTQLFEEKVIDLATLRNELHLNGVNSAIESEILPVANTTCKFIRNKSTDQDGKIAYSYSNTMGQEIAVKTIIDQNTDAITFSVYNSMGLQDKVYNPKGQIMEYKYNLMGWLYEETHPDKGMTRYMYDRNGNIVLMADAKSSLFAQDGLVPDYTYYKYDLLGKQVEISKVKLNKDVILSNSSADAVKLISPLWYESVLNYSIVLDNGTGYKFNEPFSFIKTLYWKFNVAKWDRNNSNLNPDNPVGLIEYHDIMGGIPNHTNYLNYNDKILVRSVYYNTTPSLNSVHSIASPQITGNTNLLGRISATIAYNSAGSPILYKWFSYNSWGNIDYEVHQFSNLGINSTNTGRVTKISYEYSQAGLLKTKKVWLQQNLAKDNNLQLQKSYRYSYDDWARINNVYFNNGTHNYNNGNGSRFAEIIYNDVFGFVDRVKYYATNENGCELQVDEIVYGKTIDTRNRLTSISSKLFEEKLFYDNFSLTSAYVVTNNSAHLPTNSNNFNGNINFITSEYKFGGTNPVTSMPWVANAPASDLFKGKTLYGYTYDGMNRLTNADLTIEDHLINNSSNTASTSYGDETFGYDKIGNITTLLRNNNSTNIGTAPSPLTESWDYNYTAGKNQLASVRQSGTTTDLRSYSYDQLGNVTSDNYRGITNAVYGFANMLNSFSANSKLYDYLYDENNSRVYKQERSGKSVSSAEYYVTDVSGSLLVIIDDKNSSIVQWQIEGYGKEKGGEKYYSVSDHLGNTRVTYKVTYCTSCSSGCQVLDYTLEYVADYYAYGKILREYVGIDKEKFLTTGNERDKETGWDYRMARYYDADLGRFTGVDVLGFLAPNWSSYRYAFDNPVSFVDPLGLLEGEPGGPSKTWEQTARENRGKDFDYNGEKYEYMGVFQDENGVNKIQAYSKKCIGCTLVPVKIDHAANNHFEVIGSGGGDGSEVGFFDDITSLLDRFSDITIDGEYKAEANLSIGAQAGIDLDLLGASLKLQGNVASAELLSFTSETTVSDMDNGKDPKNEFNWVGKNDGVKIKQGAGVALIQGLSVEREFIGKMGSYEELKDKTEVDAGPFVANMTTDENGKTTIRIGGKAGAAFALILGVEVKGEAFFTISY